MNIALFFALGYFFFRIGGHFMVQKLKSFHLKNNLKVVRDFPEIFVFFNWFFKIGAVISLLLSILILVGII